MRETLEHAGLDPDFYKGDAGYLKHLENTKERPMNIIKAKRKELALTQKEFAKQIGVPTYKISRMENGGDFSLTDAFAFCNAFETEFHIKEMAIQKRQI